MLDPHIVEIAQLLPGTCGLCRTHKGPFIDTRVDTPWGRVYVCVTTCGSQIADLCSSQVVAGLEAQVDELRVRIGSLLQELADAEQTRVVPLADVQRLFERGVTTAAESRLSLADVAKASGLCTATRKDGFVCTAKALSGRDVCLAHSKNAVAA